jgi:DNA-directed RNA polymerase specialized sigma24 family protein
VRRVLLELATICDAGRKSDRRSGTPWANSDAWQNTYLTLSARIADGRVDVDRPIRGLAYVTARNFFISEKRRDRRLIAIGDVQHEHFGAGSERSPEDLAEARRRGEVLRGHLVRLAAAGKLSPTDLLILIRRYVDGWSAAEVAEATGLGVDNVRQICARRRRLLRAELSDLGLGEVADGAY